MKSPANNINHFIEKAFEYLKSEEYNECKELKDNVAVLKCLISNTANSANTNTTTTDMASIQSY